MEPIRHTLTAQFKNFKMYREDLDLLVSMFEKGGAPVIISDNEYRYESLDEMKLKGKVGAKMTAFDLRCENPAVHFLFNQKGLVEGSFPPAPRIFNELRTEEISDEADSLFYRIKDFLKQYERPTIRKSCIAPALLSLAGIFWFALHNSHVEANGQRTIGSLPGTSISFCSLAFFLAVGLYITNFLSLGPRHGSASFWIRNKDAIAINAITTAIGGAVGFILGRLK